MSSSEMYRMKYVEERIKLNKLGSRLLTSTLPYNDKKEIFESNSHGNFKEPPRDIDKFNYWSLVVEFKTSEFYCQWYYELWHSQSETPMYRPLNNVKIDEIGLFINQTKC